MRDDDREHRRIQANQEELHITFDPEFWQADDTVARSDDGRTALDERIEYILDDVRAALYYLATVDKARH